MLRGKYLFFVLLHILLFTSQSVSRALWDGVFVTQSDYNSLQAIKNGFIDPNGFLQSWNDTGYGACSGRWAGIKCAHGQVIVIQLPWRGLGGRLSEKIGQLSALRKLSLHNNYIGGMIPSSLGFLPNLRGVQLFNNRFAGSIPPSIGNCLLLQTLDLSNNTLTGAIPSSLANSPRIFRLNFSFNALSGPLPFSLTRSPSLTFIALQHNNLSGPISIGGLQNLSVLNLEKNHFKGPIPTTLGNIASLTQLDLSENDFAGSIPVSLAYLTDLTFLNVSYNKLSGSIPLPLLRKFNSSSFVGNLQLCGYGISFACSSPPPFENTPPSSSEHKTPHGGRKLSTKYIIIIAAGVLLAVILLLCCILFCCLIRSRAASKAKKKGGQTMGRMISSRAEDEGKTVESAIQAEAGGGDARGKLVDIDGASAFTADNLLCATAEIMGKSSYGTVYKATLDDGIQVAVKRFREKMTKSRKEFETQVNLLGKIRHPNLLSLRAYYLGPKGEKLLIFDFIPRGSLGAFLHARGPETPIDWPTRMNIIKGVTRGLCYLHMNENLVHGNLTDGNVLLDEQANPRISDFGLSRLMTTARNSNVAATSASLGYRAPELAKLKKPNMKTDIYSLGVIMLELLTGKSPSEPTNGMDLPQWVATIVREEWTIEVFDLELMSDVLSSIGDELLKTLKLALHCVDPSPTARPDAQPVLQHLEQIKPELAATASDSDDHESFKSVEQ